jgi:hypothetical protein
MTGGKPINFTISCPLLNDFQHYDYPVLVNCQAIYHQPLNLILYNDYVLNITALSFTFSDISCSGSYTGTRMA